MLLEELGLATINPKNSSDYSHTLYDKMALRSPENDEYLGSGRDGTVHGVKSEPGVAVKVVRPKHPNNLESDMYFKFVCYLKRNTEGGQNRFFPKIYDVNLIRSRDGALVYQVKMEKLQPLETLNAEELKGLCDKLFFNFDQLSYDIISNTQKELSTKSFSSSFKIRKSEISDNILKDCYQITLLDIIINIIQKSSDPSTIIKDPEFKRALMIVKSLHKIDRSNQTDVIPNNIMIRRAPGGAQLVLVDIL